MSRGRLPGGWVNRLWIALEYSDIHTVRQLINSGININHVFKEPGHQRFGQTPAFIAASKNNRELLALLVRAGADLNLPDIMGETPLFVAVRRGKLPLAKQIVSAGACVNHRNKTGENVLFLAIRWGRKDLVDYFLSVNVDVDAVNKEGSTPLLLALDLLSGNKGIVARCSTRRRAPSNLEDVVEELIPLSSSLNHHHPNKSTALQIAVAMETAHSPCDLKLSKLLMQHGAVPDRLFFLRFGGLNAATSLPGAEFYTHRFFHLSLEAGASLQKEKTWLMPVLNEMPRELQPYEELFEELLQTSLTPMSLQSFCVISVRRMLRGPLWKSVDKLPLPNTLKSCLKLSTN